MGKGKTGKFVVLISLFNDQVENVLFFVKYVDITSRFSVESIVTSR